MKRKRAQLPRQKILRSVCGDFLESHPEYRGKECLCAECNTLEGCPGCAVCNGPVTECNPPLEGEEDD